MSITVNHTQSRCLRCLKLYNRPPSDPLGSTQTKTPCCQATYWPIHQLEVAQP